MIIILFAVKLVSQHWVCTPYNRIFVSAVKPISYIKSQKYFQEFCIRNGSYTFVLLLYIGKDCIIIHIIVNTFFNICSLLEVGRRTTQAHRNRNYSRVFPVLFSEYN
jgi:hypothetical protein